MDQLNPMQKHSPPRTLAVMDALRNDLQKMSPMTVKKAQAAAQASKVFNQDTHSPLVQAWNTDPYNGDDFETIRLVTWWHIFNVQPLTKYEVVARINQQLLRTNSHFDTGGGSYTFQFVFGGATFYNSSEAAGWVCSRPSTYQAAIALKRSGTRYVNTVVCNRGDNQMGESSFPYDINGQAFPSGEEDSRHVMQIDPEALAGGAYGSATASSKGDSSLEFNAPVFSHLLGHLFGLPHTFQDDGKCPSGAGLDNDAYVGVTDTPVQELPYAEVADCSNNRLRLSDCEIDVNGIGYLLNNIMGHALCADSFTPGQKIRLGDAAIEYHTKKLGRQDCEMAPCDPNTVCRATRIGLFQGVDANSSPPKVVIGTVSSRLVRTRCKCCPDLLIFALIF